MTPPKDESETPTAPNATKSAADANRAMNLRLTQEDAKELELVAEVEGRSVAAIIRSAIRTHLDSLAEDDDFRRRSRAVLEQHTNILGRYTG